MIVNIKVLPDGSGRVRIHWFERCEEGPVHTPGKGTPMAGMGVLYLGGARGRIACQPQRLHIMPEWRGQEVTPLAHSDDPRAVTCPECRATPGFTAVMKDLEEREKARG